MTGYTVETVVAIGDYGWPLYVGKCDDCGYKTKKQSAPGYAERAVMAHVADKHLGGAA